MKNRKHTRGLSLLLCAALLAGQLGTTVYAEGSSPGNREVVCEHHPEHTEACGYMEAEPGQPCQHQHTGDCYTNELICGFDDEDTPTATESDASAVHEHTQECYALDCPHERGEHDDTCGYVEDVPESPCTHSCELCDPQDKGNGGGANREDGLDHRDPTLETSEQNEQTTVANDGLIPPVATVSNVTPIEGNGYSFENGTLTITTNEGTVAWMYDDSINDTDITKVVVKDGVTETRISYGGNGAFQNCENLAQAELPSSLKSIGEKAFMNCGKLELAELPSDVTSIGDQAFLDCGKIELTSLPGDLTSIGAATFSGCKKLALTGLPEKVTSIGDAAFHGCENLALKSLPGGVTSIGDRAFFGCSNLTSLTIPIPNAPTLGSNVFVAIPNLTIFVPTEAKGYTVENNWPVNKLVFGAALESLTISDGDLDPDFFAGRESYAVSVPNSTTSVKVTPTAHGTGTITVNDIGIDSGDTSGEITLEAGKANEIKIVVENSSTDSRTYTVTVTRAADPACSIEVNKKSLDFGTVNVGYEVGNDAGPRKRSVVVTNTCSQVVTLTPLTLPPSTAYELAELSKLELGPDEIADFIIWPKTGLPTGTYNEQLTINGTGGASATVDLQFTVTDKPTYTVLINGGTSSGGIFQEGEPVTITAAVPSGKQFTGWTINPDNVTFTQGGKDTETATFIMPTQEVTATANFTDIPTTYTVTVNGGTSSGTIFQEGEPVTITATVPSGKQFTGWTINPDNVTFTQGGKDTETATFTMPNQTVTATANFKNSLPSGGGSGSRDSSVTITTPQPPQPDSPVLAVIKTPVTVTDGAATVTANDGDTSEGIIKALNTAKQKSREKYGIAIQYDAATVAAYNGLSITLKRATLDRLLDPNNNLKYLTLNTSIVDMTFGLAELTGIARQTSGDVTFTAARVTGLTGDALSAIGTRPAYDLKISYQKDGQPVYLSSVGSVSVGIAYTLAETEQAGGLYLVYADGKGGAEWLYRSSYDKGSGNVIGSINHFSIYGVGYRPAPIFTDTVNHWAKSDIDFVASRNLLTGTGDAAFSPDSTITRGMFVTALGRLAGIDPAAYPSSSRFSDVPATAYYAPFVEWAASKEIVNGTGAASFEPDQPVTREEIAVIMQRYAGKLGYTLPKEREAEIFADNATITSGMKDAVQAMQQAGVMNGKGGRLFAPKDTATRAEAAAVLRRFVEIVIDRDTAGGWAQNDTGSRLYYENHRPVTGWKQVEGTWYYFDAAGLMQSGGWRQIGGKWYYFYADGSMAANTEIDGYQIGPDGARNF
ncbi:MAG: leucine-rich repeat protein [Hungatella hathewayi]|uniref:leucine-rich repeat protein n=1 Tax=Hungatella TaxID=1649459 RepID=UPI001106A0F0|nr:MULTISPECIES: leucine-rich repeat protein [Hungatella]MCI7379994.1 leucine-rich repeat protein [Hungatella sp.]MDY6239979.1 leucine-rich repeat protein [Hungatella hathewayi]